MAISFSEHTKIFNLDHITNENNENHKKWPYIPDHPYRMVINGGSGSGKTNALLNLRKEQDNNNQWRDLFVC